HDHKYDPFSQEDFFRLFAYFNNVPEKGKDGRKGWSDPAVEVPDPELEPVLREQQAQLAELENRLKAQSPEQVERREQQIAAWRKEAREENRAAHWSVWEADAAESTLGVVLERQKDQSWLATKANPTNPKYTVRGRIARERISGLRLDVLRHKSLTKRRLSRSSNGNLVISEFEVARRLPGQTDFEPVRIVHAEADYSQEKWPASGLIDGKKKTGWAPEGHMKKEDRTLVFRFDRTIPNDPETEWLVTLAHDLEFQQHSTGRFRISHTASPGPRLSQSKFSEPILAALQAEEPSAEQLETLHRYYADQSPEFTALRKEIDELKATVEKTKSRAFVKVMVMKDMETPRETFVLNRGQYDQPDRNRRVTPAIPPVFGDFSDAFPANRLGLAQWITHRDNPLTARVTVNRYWQMLFGQGLVRTVEDFGAQGELPSHPDLLDRLASISLIE
ncbi:MAG: DUF1553 domain-containing protein, partial [Verrucomicrobiota bacterium]